MPRLVRALSVSSSLSSSPRSAQASEEQERDAGDERDDVLGVVDVETRPEGSPGPGLHRLCPSPSAPMTLARDGHAD
jgi:hypothetical protein